MIKLILQFLRESGLEASAAQLTKETNVSFYPSSEASLSTLRDDIIDARWDQVLPVILNSENLEWLYRKELYFCIFADLLQRKEYEAGRVLLRRSSTFEELRRKDEPKYLELERLLSQASLTGDISGLLVGEVKRERRIEVADKIVNCFYATPPARLLGLLGDAIRSYVQSGMLSAGPDSSFDIFHGLVPTGTKQRQVAWPDSPCGTLAARRAEPEGRNIESCSTSGDGAYTAIGTADGRIEVINLDSGQRRGDLSPGLMKMASAILCMSFIPDKATTLLTGDLNGEVGAWSVDLATCIKRFKTHHSDGITCILGTADGSTVITGGNDGSIASWALRMGSRRIDLKGHDATITGLELLDSGQKLLSVSSDGSLIIWDLSKGGGKSLVKLSPFSSQSLSHGAIAGIIKKHFPSGHSLIYSQAGDLAHFDHHSLSVKNIIQVPLPGEASLISAASSPKGEILKFLTNQGKLIQFKVASDGRHLDHLITLDVCAPEHAISVVSHPNLSLAFTIDCEKLCIFK